MMRLVGISGGGWGSPGLRLLLAFAKATHRLSDRSVLRKLLRRISMKKSISILAMIAGILLGAWVFSGKAHAGVKTCNDRLSESVKSYSDYAAFFMLSQSRLGDSDDLNIAFAARSLTDIQRMSYIYHKCSLTEWNKTFKGSVMVITDTTLDVFNDYFR